MTPCNLCGGAVAPETMVCADCGAGPAARIVRHLFRALPIGLLDWRRADLDGAPAGIEPHWFAAGPADDAPADFIALTLPAHGAGAAADDAADDAATVAHALARLSGAGVLFVTRAWPAAAVSGAAPGALQDGLRTVRRGAPACALLACELADPCGDLRLPVWLAFADADALPVWRARLPAWDGAARLLTQLPGAPAPDADAGDAFAPLRAELAHWQAAGRDCPLWWRDDDLVADTPALRRLAAVSARYRAPVLMAVIPAQADAGLADATGGAGMATLAFCQHGWNHVNHEPDGAPKSEFGAGRPLAAAEHDLAAGAARLRALLGARFVPVFVPPWNTLAPALAARLPAHGLCGLSQYFGVADVPVPGLQRIDTQVDIVDWGANAGVRDPAVLIERLVAMLALRRDGGDGTPVGILTHHRVMAEGTWAFLEALLTVLESFSCVCWPAPHTLFVSASTPCAA